MVVIMHEAVGYTLARKCCTKLYGNLYDRECPWGASVTQLIVAYHSSSSLVKVVKDFKWPLEPIYVSFPHQYLAFIR